ncbi:MAG: nucleotidyltransferase domain-containing protein [Spirochaetota bacterium]
MAPDSARVVEGRFLDVLKSVFGPNLLSVMAYGSYAGGDFVPGVSDVNILIILDRHQHDRIAQLGRQAHRLIRKHRITPLLLTRTEFRNSADVFPMEYFDIRERHVVLYGEDETASLDLHRRHLRHQLEEHLRGTVATLRQVLIASRGRNRAADRSMRNLFGSLRAQFRGLLRLVGADVPPDDGELIRAAEKRFGVESSPFIQLQQLRRNRKKATLELAGRVLTQLEALIRSVDANT